MNTPVYWDFYFIIAGCFEFSPKPLVSVLLIFVMLIVGGYIVLPSFIYHTDHNQCVLYGVF